MLRVASLKMNAAPFLLCVFGVFCFGLVW
jgi:hypothetical protein